MKKSTSIFASKSERLAFGLIEGRIPDGYKLYPNLPLAQIIHVEKSELSVADWEFYLKTSIDFVLADRNDQPVLAIEFDGLAGGFSWGSEYRSLAKSPDPKRSVKLDFKLSLCSRVDFPLYVISFDEIKSLDHDESRRVVHSIIGQHLVAATMKEKIAHWDRNNRGQGKSRSEMERHLAETETDLQHKYDPFRSGLESLWDAFAKLHASWSLEPLSRPDVHEALRTRQPLEAVGVRYKAQGVPVPVLLTVWVRNFAGEALGYVLSADVPVSTAVNPVRVAENVAWYLGVKKTVEANNR